MEDFAFMRKDSLGSIVKDKDRFFGLFNHFKVLLCLLGFALLGLSHSRVEKLGLESVQISQEEQVHCCDSANKILGL